MSLTLIYVSGTGNSLRVAKWFADAAVQRGQPARIVQYNQARQSLLPADLWGGTIGFVFPAHGFTAPWAMIWTALCMPHARGTSAFVAVTRAGTKFGPLFLPGMEGTAGYLLALILRLKSYCVRGMIGLDMPCNWTSVHPGFSEASARAIIGRTKPKVLAFINRILAGHSSFGLAGFICLLLGLVLLPVSLGYMLSFRFVLAKAFFASNRCTGCGCAPRAAPPTPSGCLAAVARGPTGPTTAKAACGACRSAPSVRWMPGTRGARCSSPSPPSRSAPSC